MLSAAFVIMFKRSTYFDGPNKIILMIQTKLFSVILSDKIIFKSVSN